jgi:hypothetical protein
MRAGTGQAWLLIFATLLFSPQLALAQFTQQGPKLVGTGAVGMALQGQSVALSADGNTAIIGGALDNGGAFSGVGAAWVFIRSGEPLPDLPTVAESGYKDYGLDYWVGALAPAKTPKETVSQFAGWFTAALQASELRTKLLSLGLYSVGMCGAEFSGLLRKQYDDFGRVIREANIKAE